MRTENSILAAFPLEDEEQESEEEIEGQPEDPPLSPTPTLVNELPSPPAITHLWTDPDLDPALVDLAENIEEPPVHPLDTQTTRIESSINFEWNDEAEAAVQDFLNGITEETTE
jgi:hypothetical protein